MKEYKDTRSSFDSHLTNEEIITSADIANFLYNQLEFFILNKRLKDLPTVLAGIERFSNNFILGNLDNNIELALKFMHSRTCGMFECLEKS